MVSADQGAPKFSAHQPGEILTQQFSPRGHRLATFSPDGQRVITASIDRTARVGDASSGLPLTLPELSNAWTRATLAR